VTRDELVQRLRAIKAQQEAPPPAPVFDEEVDHIEVDGLLLAFINDDEVTQIFDSIAKWYS
jgi:hypothetical protein